MCFIWMDEGLTNTNQLILQRQNLVLRMFFTTELNWCLQFWCSVHLIDLTLNATTMEKTERLNLLSVKQRSPYTNTMLDAKTWPAVRRSINHYNGVLQDHLCSPNCLPGPYHFKNYLQWSLFGSKDVTSISPMHFTFSDGNQRNQILFGLYSSIVRRLVEHSSTEKEKSGKRSCVKSFRSHDIKWFLWIKYFLNVIGRTSRAAAISWGESQRNTLWREKQCYTLH